MHLPGPSARRSLLAILLAVLALPAAAEDPVRVYEQGIAWARRARWGDVAGAMLSAIAAAQTEKAEMRGTGMKIYPYLPHYYLGLAYFELGRCEEALREWAVSERQGVIQGQPEMARLLAGRTACGPAPTPAPTPPRPEPTPREAKVERPTGEQLAAAQSLLARGESAAGAVAALRRDPLLAASWEKKDEVRARRGEELLDAARGEVSRAQDAAALQAAMRAAERAADMLVQLRDDLDHRLAALRQEERQRAAAEKLAAEQERAARDRADRERADAERTDQGRADALRARTADREALRAGLVPFFAGDYPRALAVLARQHFTTPAAEAQAQLFSAAAAHALYLLGDGKDEGQLAAAKTAIARCRELEGCPRRPDAAAFSPRFVDFFSAQPQ
jgi:hypothetical protein